MTEKQAQETKKPQTFDIRKIYLKDVSVESPNTPTIFLENAAKQEEGYYEVVLGITVTSKVDEQTAFLIEVQQAGVFHIVGLPNNDLPLALEIACPNILLPFAREAISDLVGKSGFPQLLLSPINFESLYMQKQQKKDSAEDTTTKH